MPAKRKTKSNEKRGDVAIGVSCSPSSQPRGFRRWLVWLIAFVILLLSFFGTYYLVEIVLWPRVPSTLVGQWRAQGVGADNVTLEFLPDGTFEARAKSGDESAVVHARAQTDDADHKKLHIISVNPLTQKQETRTHIIHTLTKTELVMEDPAGQVTRFVRVD